jgi:5,6,7,8-tetrahydromethanopterin hydro-lyase
VGDKVDFVTQVGEAFVGSGADAAHINTVLGSKGGSLEGAWATALASPSQGHVPFVAVLQPGLPVKPFTLFINKASIESEHHAELTWGAAQAGVAQGVAEAVSRAVIPRELVDVLLLIAAVWVNPAAGDAERVFANNSKATFDALEAGAARSPEIDRVLEARGEPFNPYFRPRS